MSVLFVQYFTIRLEFHQFITVGCIQYSLYFFSDLEGDRRGLLHAGGSVVSGH